RHAQRDRTSSCWRLNRRDSDRWRLVRIREAGIIAAVGHHDALRDLLLRQQTAVAMLGSPIGRDRPDDFFLPKVLRHTNAKDESLSSRKEVRRLTAVGPAELHVVVGSGWNRELLLPVPIEVPEHQVERPVRILDPPLEIRDDALARVEANVRKLGRKLRGRTLRMRHRDKRAGSEKAGPGPNPESRVPNPEFAVHLCARRAATRRSKSSCSR